MTLSSSYVVIGDYVKKWNIKVIEVNKIIVIKAYVMSKLSIKVYVMSKLSIKVYVMCKLSIKVNVISKLSI